jgi:soluble lytic murein transglycosylase
LLLNVTLLAVISASSGSGAWWRFDVAPTTPSEQALQASLGHETVAERVAALIEVSETHPGTTVSGLARLEAGLELLEDEKPEDALTQLAHDDLQRVSVRDHALLALARAQDALDRPEAAARSYLAAALAPRSVVGCEAFPRAAELLRKGDDLTGAGDALGEVVARCPALASQALLDLARVQIAQGDRARAAATLDRLDRESPVSDAARQGGPQLRALRRYLPQVSPAARAMRRLEKGEALLEARRTRDALDTMRTVDLRALPAGELDRARLALGRALLERRQRTEGHRVLAQILPGSPLAAEAAWYRARDQARRADRATPYVAMADAFPGTTWAQRALKSAADHFQKDALDEAAVPYWRRLLDEYPDGLYSETASWRVGWSDYRAKDFKGAAWVWERTARLRRPGSATPALLYWAARAHLALGEQDRARWLLEETVQRFKHSYHGMRAQEQLGRLGLAPPQSPPPRDDGASDVPPPGERGVRLEQLLLIDRLAEAAAELRLMGSSPRARATLAWVEWRHHRFRPAIDDMKRAYPYWLSAAGDHLPVEVWRILYPLRFEEDLLQQAGDEGLDPALVAALILQESSFDPEAISRAGARGLMQIMPATGRGIARRKHVRFRTAVLHDPRTSLDFGTYYLRQISDRFGGAAERVLAGYNAGPHRVDQWTALRPGMEEEEFIETIPFTETRFYVRLVLANREMYRRLYGLGSAAATGGGT